MTLQQHHIRSVQAHQAPSHEAKVWPAELDRCHGGVLHLPCTIAKDAVVAAHTIATDCFDVRNAFNEKFRRRGGFNNWPPVECFEHDSYPQFPFPTAGQNMHPALELGNGFRFRSAFRNSALNAPVATIGAVDGRYAERSAARDAGGNIASRTMRYGTPRNLSSPSLSPSPRDHSQQAAEQAVSQSISKPAEAIHA